MKRKELLKCGLALVMSVVVGLQPTLAYAAEIVEDIISENAADDMEELELQEMFGEEEILEETEMYVLNETLIEPFDEELIIEGAEAIVVQEGLQPSSVEEAENLQPSSVEEAENLLPSSSAGETENFLYKTVAEPEAVDSADVYTSGEFQYEELNGSYIAITRYTGSDTEIVIPANLDGFIVQKIADEAFMDHTTLEKVTLPSSCKTIGEKAFKNCSALKEIVFGTSLETIGISAFENCSLLNHLVFNEKLSNINSLAFANCTSLEEITFSESLETVGSYAFSGCAALSAADLPDNVTSIGYRAFYNCTSLTVVNYPVNWTTCMKDSSWPYSRGNIFEGCSKLTQITVPEGVSQIPDYAFAGCTLIEKFSLPSTLKSIGERAFQGCTGIESIELPDSLKSIGDYAFADCTNLILTALPSQTQGIGTGAFSGCTSISSMDFPDSVTSIGYRAFYNCTALAAICYPKGLQVCTSDPSWPYSSGNIFEGCSKLTAIEVPEGITKIPDYLFSGCTFLEEVKLPSGLTEIGSCAFDQATGLRTIEIPDTVTAIGNCAFRNCSGITSFVFGSGLTKIGHYAFEGCSGIKNLQLPDSVTEIGYRAFYNCTSLTAVNYPVSWTTCPKDSSWPYSCGSVFEGCSKLKILTIPEGVTAIPKYAFQNCSSLRTITFPSTLTEIQEHAFDGCKGIPSLILQKGIKTIGRYAFSGCEGLISVSLPDTVEQIGAHAFADCINLEQVFIPESVTEIGDGAFENSPVCLYVPTNSYAAIWAVSNGIEFRYYTDGTSDYSNYVLDMEHSSFYTNTDIACVNSYITVHLDYKIKDEYRDEISGMEAKLSVKLSPSLEFAESSLKEDNVPRTGYTYEDTLLTVPVNAPEGHLTFNAKIQATGSLSAYACLDYKKENVLCSDLIDLLLLDVPTLTLDVPEITADAKICVSGLTTPREAVKIYVNDQEAALAKALNTGAYSTYITLPAPETKQQIYTIKAERVSNAAVSASAKVIYDMEAPVVTRFDMYYMAHESKKVNLLETAGTQLSLAINPAYSFTFRIQFDNPETLKNVYVIGTKNGKQQRMQAEPTANPGEYIATGFFDESDKNYIPGSISLWYSTQFDGSGISTEVDLEQDEIPEFCQNAEVQVENDDGASANLNITLQDGTVLPVEFRKYTSVQEAEEDLLGGKARAYGLARGVESDPDLEDVKYFVEKLVEKYGDQVKSNAKDKAKENGVVVVQDGDDLIYILWNGVKETVQKVTIQGGVTFWLRSETAYTISTSEAWGYAGKYIGMATTFGEAVNFTLQLDEAQKEIRNSTTLSAADKEYALKKTDDMRVAYGLLYSFKMVMSVAKPYLTASVTAAYGPVAGILAGVVIDFGTELAEKYLDGAFDYYAQGGKGSYFKWLIDPSGYVYEAVTANRIIGAKVTAYYKETPDSAPVLWDASEDGQTNPLYTDTEGCYAWDTPEGYWQVVVELNGYQTWTSDWLSVPPVQNSVNASMISYEAPQAEWMNVYEEYAEIHFTKYMKPDTVSNVKLTDENGNEIAYTLSYSEKEANEDGTVYADTYQLVFEESREKGSICKVLIPSSVQSYAGISCREQSFTKSVRRPCTVQIAEEVSVDYGSRIEIPVVLSAYEEETQVQAVSLFPDLARVIGVEKSGTEGTWKVIVEGHMPGATELQISVKDTEIAVTVPVTILMNQTFAGFEDEPETEPDTKETEPDTKETEPDTKETEPDTKETESDTKETESDTKETESDTKETESETEETEPKKPETEAHVHSWNKGSVEQAASCSHTGVMLYTCSGCGEKKRTVISKDSSKHAYGSFKTVKAPTAVSEGLQEKTCSQCNAKIQEKIAKLPASIKLSATSITLQVKQSTTKVKVSGLAAGDKVVSWKSGDTKIVKVSQKGKITAQKKTGKTVITVTLASGKTAAVRVTVQKGAVQTKKISGLPKKITLKVKEKQVLAPVITPITSLQKVTYKSSNKKVVSVNKNGLITAKKAGTAKITVKSGKKKAIVKVTVKKK